VRAKLIYVQVNQSIWDIAIQEYGAAEGVFLVMLANKNTVESITDDLEPGTALKIWPINIIQQVAEQSESLNVYLPVLMQWIAMLVGGGSGSGLNDADYVHIRGDEVISGVKKFVDKIQTKKIEEVDNQGVDVEGVVFKDGVLDAGYF